MLKMFGRKLAACLRFWPDLWWWWRNWLKFRWINIWLDQSQIKETFNKVCRTGHFELERGERVSFADASSKKIALYAFFFRTWIDK